MQTSQATPLLTGRFDQDTARLSPDGKWLAFISNESGKAEVSWAGAMKGSGDARLHYAVLVGVTVTVNWLDELERRVPSDP
jgi:hypothetical protein